jgi:streptogramin lyase/tRNA A-37 threonylcarbamoyl transferase component Bud32
LTVLADRRIGTELAGYRVEALLGRGGMSVVYLAEHLRLKRKVALKLLAPELAKDPGFRERFLRESELAASLDHPNVVPVYDAGAADDLLYIAMRYVDGLDLKALLRREGPLAPKRALALGAQIAGALDAAHARGLVHRDVKPSNVLLATAEPSEHCYLADFGLTKFVAEQTEAQDAVQLAGTIDYVAPEQIRGAEVDARADVYSLACLLYECLVGEVPFGHASDVAVLYAHLEAAPPKPSELRSELAPVDDVIARGMAKAPEERWPTCSALVDAAAVALAPDAPVTRRRRRLALAAVAAGLAVAAAVAALLVPGGGTPVATAAPLLKIDPAGERITAGLQVRGRPTAVTTCAGNVWVTSRAGTVSQFDPTSATPRVIDVEGKPLDVADDGNLAAIVSGPADPSVSFVDAAFGKISDVVPLPGDRASSGRAVAFGRDVWIANPGAHELDRLSPPYTSISGRIRLGPLTHLTGIAAGNGALWVADDSHAPKLWRIDTAAGDAVAIALPFPPTAVAASADAVWLVGRSVGAVFRVDAKTHRLRRIAAGKRPVAVAAGAGSIWVADELDRAVLRIDPRRNVVTKRIAVGSQPLDLAVGLGAVWVIQSEEVPRA